MEATSNTSRLIALQKAEGIVPVRRLELSSSELSEGNTANIDGNDPRKFWPLKSITVTSPPVQLTPAQLHSDTTGMPLTQLQEESLTPKAALEAHIIVFAVWYKCELEIRTRSI